MTHIQLHGWENIEINFHFRKILGKYGKCWHGYLKFFCQKYQPVNMIRFQRWAQETIFPLAPTRFQPLPFCSLYIGVPSRPTRDPISALLCMSFDESQMGVFHENQNRNFQMPPSVDFYIFTY